jgi:NAD-dependent deacetylase
MASLTRVKSSTDKVVSADMKRHIVVLSGAGISAESGLATFRDNDGLWERHSVHDVATPEAFQRDPALVLRFYNERRRQLANTQPNRAHRLLAELERRYQVTIVTQNVDDLHERGGSTRVLHLHGELTKARSSKNPRVIHTIGYRDIRLGERSQDGSQLRPHIVWFGEDVPMLEVAIDTVRSADDLLIVGTSLQVYPAASLVHEVERDVPITVIDPVTPTGRFSRARCIQKSAVEGVAEWVNSFKR